MKSCRTKKKTKDKKKAGFKNPAFFDFMLRQSFQFNNRENKVSYFP